jgi:hypothetical protein
LTRFFDGKEFAVINTVALKKWVEALRTGGYTKIEKFCRTQEGFCAAGIGLDVSNTGYWRKTRSKSTSFSYYDQNHINVFTCAAIYQIYGLNEDQFDIVTYMNDTGRSFAQIADYLESLME